MIYGYTSDFLKKPLRFKIYVTFFLVALISFSACKKEETDTNVYSALSIYNASPTPATYDVFLDDTKINTAALPLGGNMAYFQKVTGSYTVKFTVAGRTESLFSKTIALPASTYATYFLIGKPTAFEGLLITDDLSGTSTTNGFIRFINLSPDAPALDLVVRNGSTLTTNKAYKAASGFAQLAAGTYAFDIKNPTTGTVIASVENVIIGTSGYYNVIVRGLLNPTASESGLSAQAILIK